MFMGLGMSSRPLRMAAGLAAALVMAFGLQACSDKKDEKKTEEKKSAVHASTVNYAVVGQVTAPITITGSGTVSAWQEVPVAAETGGLTAVALLVDEGAFVKQGQPLLKMNDVLLQAQFKQAKASYDQAQKAYDRANTLFKQGYLSAAALDNAQASMLTTQAAMETAQTQLSLATVRAPVSGIITKRSAVLGQVVSPGAELFRMVRDGRVELNMEVVETELALVRPNMAATVTSQSTGPVTGTVRIVTPQVDAATRLGYARISVPWDSGLRPGMFAQGSIDAGSQPALVIPQSAVAYAENKPGVYVIGPANKVAFRNVILGGQQGKDIIVRDGLTAGERIVTTGSGFLNNGDTVKLAGNPQTTGL